jgi:hypothetical protein
MMIPGMNLKVFRWKLSRIISSTEVGSFTVFVRREQHVKFLHIYRGEGTTKVDPVLSAISSFPNALNIGKG